MKKYYSEQDLHEMLSSYLSDQLSPYEDDLVKEIMRASDDPINREDTSKDDLEWFEEGSNIEDLPPAQLVTRRGYVYLEDFSIDLILTLIQAGVLDSILCHGHTLSPFGCIAGLINLARKAGQYFVSLNPAEQDFCRHLVTRYYTYSDRLRELFDCDTNGFPLSEAIESYCLSFGSADAEATDLRQSTKNAAKTLIKKGILVRVAQSSMYTIHF